MMISPTLFENGSISGPSFPQSLPCEGNRLSKSFANLNQRSGNSTNGDHDIVTLIPALIFNRIPLHVCGFIVAVILDSLQGKPIGRLSHIFKPISEHLPTITDRNSPGSITLEIDGMGIATTLNHMAPNPHSFGNMATPRMSMFKIGLLPHFNS